MNDSVPIEVDVSNYSMSFSESLQWLFARTNYENFKSVPARQYRENLGLLRDFLDFLGAPDRNLCLVHVAGTKGKGSVCVLLEALLRRCGYRTGLFTSPHLESILERFMLQGKPCDEALFTRIFNRLVERWDEFCKRTDFSDQAPEMTFFEWSVAIALTLFAEQGVDCIILETGLGGRFDATNVCRPTLSVVTSISYDHMDVLGDTLEAIAGEKLGIVRPGVPLVFSVASPLLFPVRPDETPVTLPGGSMPIAPENVERLRNMFHAVAEENGVTAIEVTEIAEEFKTVPMAVSGRHERWNASIVKAIAECLRGQLTKLDDVDWCEVLGESTLPGRIERVCDEPVVIIDGAHNRISCRALAATLMEEYNPYQKTILFGASTGKDLEGMFYELLPCFDQILFVQATHNPRAVPADELMKHWNNTMNALQAGHRVIPAAILSDPDSFIDSFLARKEKQSLLCVSGSFYLAGQVRKLLRS